MRCSHHVNSSAAEVSPDTVLTTPPFPTTAASPESAGQGREAHPSEILHRVVWGEGAQVRAGPFTRKRGVRPGHRFLGEDLALEPSP